MLLIRIHTWYKLIRLLSFRMNHTERISPFSLYKKIPALEVNEKGMEFSVAWAERIH